MNGTGDYQTQVAISTPFDNSSNGYTANNVQAAILESATKLTEFEATATTSTNTSSGTDALMNSMTLTLAAGTYIAWFSCDINSPTAGAAISVSLYNNAVQIADSLRKIIPFSGGTLTSGSARGCVAINKVVTVSTGNLEVRWSTSSGTVTAASRTLTVLRVG